MKTKSLFIAVLVIVGAVVSAAGNDAPGKGLAVVPVKGSEVFKVIYKGDHTGRIKLSIYNAQAQVVLRESYKGLDGFIIPVNFKGLPFGEYIIELVDAYGKYAEKINYAPQKKSSGNVHVSKLPNGNGRYLLSIVNGANEHFRVRIYDVQHNVIHTETKLVTGDFAQVFNVIHPAGSYTFEVTDDSGNVKTFNL